MPIWYTDYFTLKPLEKWEMALGMGYTAGLFFFSALGFELRVASYKHSFEKDDFLAS
jgi:hypothetical protein